MVNDSPVNDSPDNDSPVNDSPVNDSPGAGIQANPSRERSLSNTNSVDGR